MLLLLLVVVVVVVVFVAARVVGVSGYWPSMRTQSESRPAGHELRNPLHGVCAGITALRDGTLSLTDAEAHEELKSIAEGVALMVNITNDMTDLHKLRSGQFAVHMSPCSLRHVLESCVLAVLPAVTSPSHIQLVYDESAVPDQVRLPPQRLPPSVVCACSCSGNAMPLEMARVTDSSLRARRRW